MESDDDTEFKDASDTFDFVDPTPFEIPDLQITSLPPEVRLQLQGPVKTSFSGVSDTGSVETSLSPELRLDLRGSDGFPLSGTSNMDRMGEEIDNATQTTGGGDDDLMTFDSLVLCEEPVAQSMPSEQTEKKTKLTEGYERQNVSSADSTLTSCLHSSSDKTANPPSRSPLPERHSLYAQNTVGSDLSSGLQGENDLNISRSVDHGLDFMGRDSASSIYAIRQMFEPSTGSQQDLTSKPVSQRSTWMPQKSATLDRMEKLPSGYRKMTWQPPPQAGHQMSQQPAGHQLSQQPAGHQMSQQPARQQMSQQPARQQMSQQPARQQMSQQSARQQMSQQPARQQMSQQPARQQMSQQPARQQMSQQPARQQMSQQPARQQTPPQARHSMAQQTARHQTPQQPVRHQMPQQTIQKEQKPPQTREWTPPQARKQTPSQTRQRTPPQPRQQTPLQQARQQVPLQGRQQTPPQARQQTPPQAGQQTPPQAKQHHETSPLSSATPRYEQFGFTVEGGKEVTLKLTAERETRELVSLALSVGPFKSTDKSATAPCTILVESSGFFPDEDMLSMYFDNPNNGGSIKEMACYPDEGYAIITFKDPEAVTRVMSCRHSLDKNRTWLDIKIYPEHPPAPESPEPDRCYTPEASDTGQSSTAPSTVRVAGSGHVLNEDILRIYFDNPNRGGPIKEIACHPDEGYALIEFQDPEVVTRVMSRRHSLDRERTWVEVTIHHDPPSSPEPDSYCTVEVSGHPIVLDEDKMSLYFTSNKSRGGEITNIQRLEGRCLTLITFKEHAVAKAVVDKAHHTVGRVQITVVPYIARSSSSLHLKLSGLASTVDETLLELYFQNLIDDDVEIDHLDAQKGEAVVTFPNPEAVKVVLEKEHVLKKQSFTVSKYTATPQTPEPRAYTATPQTPEPSAKAQNLLATVCVKGMPVSDCNQELVTYYFENPKSGGKNVKCVQLDSTRMSYLVTFENPEDAANVVSRRHRLDDHVLEVELYQPPEVYKDRFTLSNLPEVHMSENLQNYVEAKSPTRVHKIFFGDEEGVAVVIFETDIDDPDALQRALTKNRSFQNLSVDTIPVSRTVLVRDLPEVTEQNVKLYFENHHRSGGEDVTDVSLNSSMRCALVTFEDPKVADRVANRAHTIRNRSVTVSVYLECLGLGGGSEEPTVNVPPPLPVSAEDLHKISLLDQLPTQKDALLALMEQGYASLEVTATGSASISCTLTDAVEGCRRLARSWESDTQRALQDFLDDIFSEQLEVTEEEFSEIQSLVEKAVADKSNIGFLLKVESNILVVVYKGAEQKSCVDCLLEDVRPVLSRVRRKKKEITETMDYAQGQQILLQRQPEVLEIFQNYPDFQVTYQEEEGRVQLRGLKEEISAVRSVFQSISSAITSLNCAWETDLQGRLFAMPSAVRVVESCCLQEAPDCVVKVTTKSLQIHSFEERKANEALEKGRRCVQQKDLIFNDADKAVVSTEKWTQLKQSILSQKKGEMLLDENSSSLTIVSVSATFDSDFKRFKDFLSENRTEEHASPLPECLHKLYKLHLDTELNALPSSPKDAFKFDAMGGKVIVKGTTEFLSDVSQIYASFREMLTGKCKTYSRPFLKEFFTRREWSNKKEVMFNDLKCVMVDPGEVTEDFMPGEDTSADPFIGDQKWNSSVKHRSSRPVPPQKPLRVSSLGEDQGSLGVELKQDASAMPVIMVKVSDITKEEVEVVVNSVANTLELDRGAVSKALLKAAGSSIQDECKASHPDGINVGAFVVTRGGGKLLCKKIIHYALPAEEDHAKMPQAVHDAVQKCLAKVDKLELTSVAFPALGTGTFNFPVAMVLDTMGRAVTEYGQQHVDTRIVKVVFALDESFAQETPKKPKVMTKRADITKERLDIVVNSVSTALEMDKGQVAIALAAAGGSAIQEECKAKFPNGISVGEVAVTGAGNLPCKKIFHFALQSTDDTKNIPKAVESAVQTCLKKADELKLTSIGFPSLGTGNFGFPATMVAQTMFDAALNYGRQNTSTSIETVVFILYEKDKIVTKAFEDQANFILMSKLLHNKTSTQQVMQPTPPAPAPRVRLTNEVFPYFGNKSESVQKVIIGLHRIDVKEAEKQMLQCYDEQVELLSIDSKDLEHWEPEHKKVITGLCKEKHVNVTFNYDQNKLEFCGFWYNLLGLNQKIRDVENEVHRCLKAKLLKEQVQWKYVEVTTKGECVREYSALNNLDIESAYLGNKAKFMVERDGAMYIINFDKWEEIPENPGDQNLMVIRKNMLEGVDVELPPLWSDMKGKTVDFIDLVPSSVEYGRVYDSFVESLGTATAKVVKIVRIQNLIVFKQYHALKRKMEVTMPSSLAVQRERCERTLWYGVEDDTVDRIIENGINRGYNLMIKTSSSGIKQSDADAKKTEYGQGAHFTSSVKHCCEKGYVDPNSHTKERNVFRCKVLVGHYLKGNKGMRLPPTDSSGNLCNSTVDNESEPKVFVTYHDAQAYPEYRIVFLDS